MGTALALKYAYPEESDMAPAENADGGSQIGKLSSDVQHVQSDINGIKTDIREIRADVRGLDQRMTAGFERIEAKLDQKIGNLDTKVENKIDALDKKFETKFDAMDAKFEKGFGDLDAKFEKKTDDLYEEVGELKESLASAKIWALGLYIGMYVTLAGGLLYVIARGNKWI